MESKIQKQDQPQQHVYYERQGQTQLCGVHCVNTILQGPYYNEISLAEIALQLDKQEKELLLNTEQGVENPDYIQLIGQGSQNVAMDGNYSIQVLKIAMQKFGEIEIDHIESQRSKKMGDLSNQYGFICNSESHWFTIRKVNKIWYNLNSTNELGPEVISDFYMSAFLNSVKENGYTIFIVKGKLPNSQKSQFKNLFQHQLFFTDEECQVIWSTNKADKNYKLNINGTDQKSLEQAMKESLQMYQNQQSNQFNQQKIKTYIHKVKDQHQKDPELQWCIKESLQSKFKKCPEQTKQNYKIEFIFQNSQKEKYFWVFEEDQNYQDLFDFAYIQMSNIEGGIYNFQLKTEQNNFLEYNDTKIKALNFDFQFKLYVIKI